LFESIPLPLSKHHMITMHIEWFEQGVKAPNILYSVISFLNSQ